MYHVYKLDDKSYVAHILDSSSTLLSYLKFISSLKEKDTIETYLHPYDQQYMITASIPYEHFEKGRWNFNTEVMMLRAEKLVKLLNNE